MARGLFITLEGGEGAGKSTQAQHLATRIEAGGGRVVRTREPGGSVGAEEIRQLLVTGASERWSPMTETLLMNAARRDHIEQVIAPALARGEVVICDRFADSTRAYQGAAGKVDPCLIETLEGAVLRETRPDLTLIFDLPVAVGLARARARDGGFARFEGKGEAFHESLRTFFLGLAKAEPDRCVLIDGSLDQESIAESVWNAVAPRLTA